MMSSFLSRFKLTGRGVYNRVQTDSLLPAHKRPYEDAEDDQKEYTSSLESTPPVILRQSPPSLWMTGSLVFFIFLSIALFAAYLLKHPTDEECGLRTEVWTPASQAVEYVEMDFENAFAHDTIYRGPPTPALEKAWEELWFYSGIRIQEDKLHLLNRSADFGDGRKLLGYTDEEGGYTALIEVFHQLHCLNLIRQFTWRDWYGRHEDIVRTPSDLQTGDVGARMHVDHCIEALRISLMCHGDTTPYFIIKDPTAPGGERADFSPHHKCRKFENLQEWVRDNQVMTPKPLNWEPKKQPSE